MPSILEIIATLIAISSLIIAFLNFRDRRTDKTEKDLEDKLKANVLQDATSLKASILAEVAASVALEIKELQKQSNECEIKHAILEERLKNEIDLLEKLEEKIDAIARNL